MLAQHERATAAQAKLEMTLEILSYVEASDWDMSGLMDELCNYGPRLRQWADSDHQNNECPALFERHVAREPRPVAA